MQSAKAIATLGRDGLDLTPDRDMSSLLRCCVVVILACAGAVAAADKVPKAPADYPVKPVRLVMPAPPGGTIDPITRILAEALGRDLGQNFVVDTRPGANFNVGMALVAKSDPDGYTLVIASSGALATNISLYAKLPFHPVRDFDPIALYGDVPNILVVNLSLPPKTLKEFTDYVRANPGKLNYGSTGNGSSMHLAAELFKSITGTQMTHIPYVAAGVATQDLIAGRTQVMFQLVTGVAPFVKSERLRAIAVLSKKRSSTLPEVPTTAEAGMPELLSSAWFGVLAPKGAPRPIIAKLNREMNRLLEDPAFRRRIVDIGVEPMGGSPEDFARFLDSEIGKWAEVVRVSGARID